MKKLPALCISLAFAAITTFDTAAHAQAVSTGQGGRSVITGTVFVEAHRPIADVWVELLDDFNSTISRVKTDGS